MTAVAGQPPLVGRGRKVEQDFERLYQQYAGDVFRYALLVLRSRPDAEDVTQATFIRAYRAVQRGERVRKPHHWLITIAHNECRRHLRTVSHRAVEVQLDESLAPAPEPVGGPTAQEIRDALSYLSFNQRAALVMRELEDRSYAEIADVLELSVSAVETLLFRARRALREQMEGPLECGEAEELLSKQIDGELVEDERRRLRAHVRTCSECATLERRARGRRAALRRLGSIITPPSSFGSFFGGGGGAVATATAVGAGAKVAAIVVAALALTAGAPGAKHHAVRPAEAEAVPVASAVRSAPPAPRSVASARVRRAAKATHSRTVGGSKLHVARTGTEHPVRPAGLAAPAQAAASGGAAPAAAGQTSPAVSVTQQVGAVSTPTASAGQPVKTIGTVVGSATQLLPAPAPAPITVPSVTVPAPVGAPVTVPSVPVVAAPAVTPPAVTLPPVTPTVPSVTVPPVTVPAVTVPPVTVPPVTVPPAATVPTVPLPTPPKLP